MTLEALYPAGGNNAIQSVAFVIEWASPLADSDVAQAKALHASLSSDLPTLTEPQVVTITVDAHQGMASPVSQSMQGVHFMRPSAHPSGFSRSLQVNRDHLVVAVNDYDRWSKVFPVALGWLTQVLAVIGKARQFTTVSLQYSDSFIWRDDPQLLDLRQVFRPESPYIPARALDAQSLWHAHQGYMGSASDPCAHKTIDNLNVDVVDSGHQRVINVVTLHRALMDSPIWQAEELINYIEALYQSMHLRNKEIFTSVFSDAVCQKIGLALEAA